MTAALQTSDERLLAVEQEVTLLRQIVEHLLTSIRALEEGRGGSSSSTPTPCPALPPSPTEVSAPRQSAIDMDTMITELKKGMQEEEASIRSRIALLQSRERELRQQLDELLRGYWSTS